MFKHNIAMTKKDIQLSPERANLELQEPVSEYQEAREPIEASLLWALVASGGFVKKGK